jgi:hypothetical protein
MDIRPELQPIRFGEFLFERRLLTEHQLLEALADHWSNGGRIGTVIGLLGFLSPQEVERQASMYHGLDVVEVEG